MRLTAEGAATRLEGPLLFLRRTLDVGLHDAVEVIGTDGHPRRGRIAALDETHLTVEVLESTAGLTLPDTVVRFLGEPPTFGLAPSILGRVFNGVGQVIDGGPPIAPQERQRIDGLPINPVARASPRDFIETGVTTLDLMNSLVRGQKLPIFSGGGLPHDRLAVEIARHARLRQAGAGAPAAHLRRFEQPVFGQFGRQPHRALGLRVVGDEHLVHALEVVHAHQREGGGVQPGFFGDLAADALFRRLAGFHETGDQAKHAVLPGGVARQQHAAFQLDDGGEHRRGVVPVGEVAGGAAQALLEPAVLPGFGQRQRGGAAGAEAVFAAHRQLGLQAGNTPVDR